MSASRTLDYDWTYVLDLRDLLTVLFCSNVLWLPVCHCGSVTWLVYPVLLVFSVSTCVPLVPQPISSPVSCSPLYLSPVFALFPCWSVNPCHVSYMSVLDTLRVLLSPGLVNKYFKLNILACLSAFGSWPVTHPDSFQSKAMYNKQGTTPSSYIKYEEILG